MATRSTKRNKRGISVDFSDTTSNAVLPEDEYLLEVEDVEQKTSENSGNDYLAITFKVAEGKHKGQKVWHNCSLQPQALFNLRSVLEALGFTIPQGSMELDPADMIGEVCGGTIAHETYEGKKKARVIEFFSPDEGSGEGDEEDEESDDSEGSEDSEVTYEEVQEMEKDDLLELAEEHSVKLTVKQKKSVPAIREAICKALELEAEEDEEAEEESDDESDGITYEDVQGASKEELLEIAADNDIKLTLKQKKSLDLMREAICDKLGLEGGAIEIDVGAKVTFTDDEGEELEGKVTALTDGIATVKVGKEDWEIEVDELTLA